MNKGYTEALELENDRLKNSIRFVPGWDVQKYEKYINNLYRLFEVTGASVHLINICRAEKKMYGSYTSLAKKAAIKGFKKNRNEMTLHYALETSLTNQRPDTARKKLDEIFTLVRDPDLFPVKNIYAAGLANKQGNFLEANRRFYHFKKDYKGKVLWQSKFLVTDFTEGRSQIQFLGNNCGIDTGPVQEPNAAAYVLSVSCNKLYFDLYAETFFASVRRNCSRKVIIHLALINIDECYAQEMISQWAEDLIVFVKYFDVEDAKEVPASATARLVMIETLLKKFFLPVFYCEIDSVIVEDLDFWVIKASENDADHVVRSIGALLPWQMFTCGFGLVLPSESGLKLSELIQNYSKGLFKKHAKLAWADQAVLEGAIRFSSLVDGGYKFFCPENSQISEYIATPTGSHTKKKLTLRRLSKVE